MIRQGVDRTRNGERTKASVSGFKLGPGCCSAIGARGLVPNGMDRETDGSVKEAGVLVPA